MSSTAPAMQRFFTRIHVEHVVAAFTLFFGLHVGLSWYLADRYHAFSAFATILPTSNGRHHETLYLISLPLVTAAFLMCWGLEKNRKGCLLSGLFIASLVYLSALLSCCLGNALGTGVGAYAGLVSVCTYLFLADSIRTERDIFK